MLFGKRSAHDVSDWRKRIDTAHGLKRCNIEARECVCSGKKDRLCRRSQFSAVVLKNLGCVEIARIGLHFDFDEHVIASAQVLEHLLRCRHNFGAGLQTELADFVKAEAFGFPLAVCRAVDLAVVHDDQPAVLGEADVHLETANATVETPFEASGGVVFVFAPAAAMRLYKRTACSFKRGVLGIE